MAFQRTLSRLQGTPYWKPLEEFSKDESKLEHGFGTRVTSAAREDIRQICKYMGLNFRCAGNGSQKRIMALKLDLLRERARAEELCKDAPKHTSGYFKSVLRLLPEHRNKVTALFVQHYGGEKAWSLGEDYGKKPAEEQEGGDAKRQRTEAASESDDEDIEELLNRYVAVGEDGSMGM
uniref:Uncharacterized protein n=1 Tax=Alexandrium andersonii TaxID=327968 RepID=A0A7S2H3I1_9DINO|mmetsp:Transcript_67360/g.150894  ORF Transcript_67360/g.150894 Transcript_67360/m.150894 type:complete len:178 (+) Transcript_67360:73-606(+)